MMKAVNTDYVKSTAFFVGEQIIHLIQIIYSLIGICNFGNNFSGNFRNKKTKRNIQRNFDLHNYLLKGG